MSCKNMQHNIKRGLWTWPLNVATHTDATLYHSIILVLLFSNMLLLGWNFVVF